MSKENENEIVVLEEVKYPVTKESIQALIQEYKDIPDIDLTAPEETIGEQYQLVLKGHKRFIKARTDIEKKRKILKEPALAYGKQVDNIAKEFTAMLAAKELELKTQREKVEQEEQRKQDELIAAENKRQREIDEKINFLKTMTLNLVGTKSTTIQDVLDKLEVPTIGDFYERTEEALNAFMVTKQQLETMLQQAITVENAEKIAAEAEEKQKAAQAAAEEEQRKEREAFEAEKKAFAEEKLKADREAMERQEELNRQEAAKAAEELEKQQAEEAAAKAKQSEEEFEAARLKTLNTLHDLILVEKIGLPELIEDIINGVIPNVKWEID